MSSRFVSIGVPVYNGGKDLQRALDALVVQTHENLEIIISDNASTDGITEQITTEYARRYPRIRLTRQPVNQGGTANFMWLLKEARGEYFMWAAHDDCWSPNYVEELANCLDEAPDASFSTPFTEITATGKRGEIEHSTFPAAPNADRWTTLDVYMKYPAGTWCYGIHRTEFLRSVADELWLYSPFAADRIWMFGILLQRKAVGAPKAIFKYTSTYGKYKDLTWRKKMESWASILYHATRLAWVRLPPSERPKGLYRAWKFYYLHQIRRGNPIGTTVRALKVAAIWTWFGIEALVGRLKKSAAPTAKNLPAEQTPPTMPATTTADDRRAA